MPYVDNYIEILKRDGADFDVINWDRFNIEDESELTYEDAKIGHQRGFLDYFNYCRFVLSILKRHKYERIIIFGIQLLFFLRKYLIKKYSNKFIVDIRDYNKIIKCFNIQKVINNSTFTVISSPGFKEWLPKSNKYIINHNTIVESLDELREIKTDNIKSDNISIGCIGALRDYQINIDLIKSLKNNKLIHLNYHGEGNINREISKYLIENRINNVSLTGRYAKEQEEDLYYLNDMINLLRYNDSINNKTALPNRLYNSVIYGKPMLAYKDTYLSDEIAKNSLGLVIYSLEDIEIEIKSYLKDFNFIEYENSRIAFFSKIINENLIFFDKLKEFINYC